MKKLPYLLGCSVLLVGCAEVKTTPTASPKATTSPTSSSSTMQSDDSHFDDEDLKQSPSLTDATKLTLENNTDTTISKGGTYIITGEVSESSLIIDTEETVHLVLQGVTITNSTKDAIKSKNTNKVLLTLQEDNTITIQNTTDYKGIDVDGTLVLNGTGTLTMNTSDNAITADTLKITGATYNITSNNKAFKAKTEMDIYDGNFTINAADDGIHVENDEDDSVGSLYIKAGNFNITSQDDAIHATTQATFEGGTYTLSANEAIEATVLTFDDGTYTIEASDDGINASAQSTIYSPSITFNGGSYTINMAQGDTDAIDVNGDLTIHGGTFTIRGQSAFDFDGNVTWDNGTITVNGQSISDISQASMQMGQGGKGGMTPPESQSGATQGSDHV